MESKKSPKGRKRTSKGVVVPPPPPPSEEHHWDCSVCTFRNNAEAFKCSMCDVRKGTSTRKPRINPDLVAAQQAQALTPPPPSTTPTPSSSNSTHMSGDEGGSTHGGHVEEEAESAALATLKSNKKGREPKTKKKEPSKKSAANSIPRLKNVDRGSATYHSVTVNDFTVVITEFKPRIKKEPKKSKMASLALTSVLPGGATSSGGLLQVDDESSSNRGTSRSPSVSGDGMVSDENSRPNGSLLANASLDSSSGF